ncbi:MAG: hypothetical protein CMN32_06515 [Saprospirales bacterium]|nr:hypothetical protein [Saprospirales bacterium]
MLILFQLKVIAMMGTTIIITVMAFGRTTEIIIGTARVDGIAHFYFFSFTKANVVVHHKPCTAERSH